MSIPIGPKSISRLPSIKFDGEYRVLGCIPSDNNHDFPNFGAHVMSQSELQEIDLAPVYNNRILNQGATSGCVGHGTASGVELAWKQLGHNPQNFSPFFIYGLVNGGRDAGAMISSALMALKQTGACPAEIMPPGVMFQDEFPPEAMTQAARFKLSLALKCNSYDDICQAINLGYATPLGIMVGDDFANLDNNGVAPLRTYGGGGHCILGVGLKKHPTYGWLIKIQNSWGCYDKETEVLTSNGWKKFENLSDYEAVATLNPTTHELEYQIPTARQIYYFDGKMLHHRSRDVDLLVTPNHNMYIRKHHRIKTHDKNPSGWELLRADETPKTVSFKKNCKWIGKEEKYHQVGNQSIPMDLWLEFLGYFISEGHTSLSKGKSKTYMRTRTRKNKNNSVEYKCVEKGRIVTNHVVGISQSKPCNLKKIQACLDKLPYTFTRHGESWTTNSQTLYAELKPLGKAGEKYLPNYTKNLCSRQQSILFDALMLGDGSYSKCNTGVKASYYTSSKILADDVQELLLKIGYAGDIAVTNRIGRFNGRCVHRLLEYRVGIKKHEVEQRVQYMPQKTQYTGKVYCVTVPNHIIYVRRNGKAVWCGNSNFGMNGYAYLRREHFDQMAPDAFAIQTVFDDPQDTAPDDNVPVVTA